MILLIDTDRPMKVLSRTIVAISHPDSLEALESLEPTYKCLVYIFQVNTSNV